MNSRQARVMLGAVALTGYVFHAMAGEIPLALPRPDGKPGDATKPVKVYILAGQSNMVGMGDLTGTRPVYPSVFLSADPALVPGAMPIGRSVLAAHGVYQSAEANAAKGAKASLFKGAYDPKADYTQLTPVKTATVALGTVSQNLPTMDGPHTVVVNAAMDVPASGSYTVHAGFENSACNVVTLDGKEVYRKEPGGKPVATKVVLEQGKRYPVTITYFKGGSAAFWLEQVDLEVKGDLETVTKKDKKFQYLLDDAGTWTVRNDVYFQEARLVECGKGCPLSATANSTCLPKSRSIGPEVGFGYVMGTFHDEQVLLIKTSQGNRSLCFDFRPPSGRLDTKNEYEGMEYRLMVKGVQSTLANIAKIVPGYKGQGYEIAGFGWFQGHKDLGTAKEEYEKNLVNLINDLRKDLNAPKMCAVVATVGFHGYRLGTEKWNWKGVWEAQMAVGDPKQHPEYAGTVASVDTRDFWREAGESPSEQDYHYNRNAETYMLVGEAMGRAMVRLEGGQAAAIPKSDLEARTAARMAAEAARAAPTDEQKAASLAAVKPMILNGALVAFATDERNQSSLQEALKGEKKGGGSQYVDDILDEACEYYRKVGISDYDWKPFDKSMTNATWAYYSFNLPKVPVDPKAKTVPVAEVTYPAGMENWFALDFNAQKAGWKSGAAPFGEKGEADDNRNPATLCSDDVLLLSQSFDLPPFKPDCRYRIRMVGSSHKNLGEGYAIYINGNLLAESKNGVVAWRKEGHKPRGSLVSGEFRDAFKGGKVTLAVSNFPMSNWPAEWFVPARAALSVCIEEMKLPPLGE